MGQAAADEASPMNSFLLTAFVLVSFLAIAAGLRIFDAFIRRRFGIRLARFRWLAVSIAVFAIAAAWFVFATDYRSRITTLHEEIIDGMLGLQEGAKASARSVRFEVEHPGVEHTLFVAPMICSGIDAYFEIQIACRLEDAQGEVLIDEVHTFKPGKRLSRLVTIRDWESAEWHFTPATRGEYTVIIRPQTTDIPKLHVRITDPFKRDGKRMPGY
jgi:hypothetical protein